MEQVLNSVVVGKNKGWSTFTRESRRTTEELLKSIVGGQVVEEVVAGTAQQFHVPACLFSFFPFPQTIVITESLAVSSSPKTPLM